MRHEHSIPMLCEAFQVSPSGFYAWDRRRRNPGRRAVEDQILTDEVVAIHAESRQTYGSPRIVQALRSRGRRHGRNRVARLLKSKGLSGRQKGRYRVRTTDSNHGGSGVQILADMIKVAQKGSLALEHFQALQPDPFGSVPHRMNPTVQPPSRPAVRRIPSAAPFHPRFRRWLRTQGARYPRLGPPPSAFPSTPEDPIAIEENLSFLERHQERMRYGTYRKNGWFIGSGVIEAGCKTVVGRRLKQSGMFWSESGATGVLNFRTLLLSGRFHAFWLDRANHHAARNDVLALAS